VPNSGKIVDVCGLCGGKSKVEDCKGASSLVAL
jgi:hypothetical protein